MKKTLKAAHVANYILELAKRENYKITNLKLQKLVYILYGFHYALTKEKLFSDEIQAWKHGPVIPSLYYQAMHFSSQHINTEFCIQDISEDDSDMGIIDKVIIPKITDKEMRSNLQKLWDAYKGYDAWSLRELTHLKGTPWYKVYNNGEGNRKVIKGTDIQSYYYDTFVSAYGKNAEPV